MATAPLRKVRLRRRRVASVALFAVAAIGAAAWGWSAFGAGQELSWVAVQRGDLVIGVEIEGTLASRDSSLLTPPQVPGIFDFKIRLMAPEGTRVDAGLPVLGFDTTELDQRLLSLQNEAERAAKNIDKLDADQRQKITDLELQLAEAEARLGKAELANDVPDDLRSADDAEKARLDVELARTEVASLQGRIAAARAFGKARREALVAQRQRARNRVRETQDAIQQMTVRAPRAGTVIYVPNWRGDKKKVGDSAWRQEKILELPDLEQMMARGEVDEADGGRVQEGQAVALRLDAHPEIEYTARVESIWRTVQPKRNSRNPLKVVRLDLALDQTDTERMRPGMRFRGTVEVERLHDVVLIPARAVFAGPSGPVAYRRSFFGYEAVPLQLGRRDASQIEVRGGLAEGDRVADSAPSSGVQP